MSLSSKINRPSFIASHKNLELFFNQFCDLLLCIEKKTLTTETEQFLISEIEQLNQITIERNYFKQLRASQKRILDLLEKKLQIVPKNHYRNQWMVLGMTAFGLPFGVVFANAIGNLGFMGIGLPIGIGIGIAIGTAKDNKTASQGKQLDITLKHH